MGLCKKQSAMKKKRAAARCAPIKQQSQKSKAIKQKKPNLKLYIFCLGLRLPPRSPSVSVFAFPLSPSSASSVLTAPFHHTHDHPLHPPLPLTTPIPHSPSYLLDIIRLVSYSQLHLLTPPRHSPSTHHCITYSYFTHLFPHLPTTSHLTSLPGLGVFGLDGWMDRWVDIIVSIAVPDLVSLRHCPSPTHRVTYYLCPAQPTYILLHPTTYG
jgi:hypothetical protein